MLRGDPEYVQGAWRRLLSAWAGNTEWPWYLALGEVDLNWARARLGDRESGMTGLREALAAYLGFQGNKLYGPLFQGRLAELEAEGG